MDLTNSKYLTGKNAQGETVTIKLEDARFGSRKEMTAIMSSKSYQTDPECRALVAVMLQRGFSEDDGKTMPTQGPVTGRDLNRALADKAGARRLEDEAIFREESQKLFADPRYATSPSYRREVENWIRANNDAIDQILPKGSIVDRNQTKGAIRVTIGETSDMYKEIKAAQQEERAAKEKADLAEKHAALDRGEATEHFDLGGQRV